MLASCQTDSEGEQGIMIIMIRLGVSAAGPPAGYWGDSDQN
jgi:hypothetical protein